MDRREYVHRRKGRYMAQTLEEFERLIEPLIDPEVAAEFKGIVRRKITALAVDCANVLDPNFDLNAYATELRDRLQPEPPKERLRT